MASLLRLEISTSEFGLNVLKVCYPNEQTLEIDLNDFYKDENHLFNLYTHINLYLATLPSYTQKEIYDVYYKVLQGDYRSNFGDHGYIVKLENNIAKVCDLLGYENFKVWIGQHETEMIFPENIRDEYIYDPDMNTTQEKTYVRHEYRDLIGLILFIRMLSPLYIDFYNYIKNITAHHYYKLFLLFIRSTVYSSPEIEKLKRYIEVNQETLIGTGRNEHLIISAGLSDDDVLDSLVSEIIFNKLLTIDFFTKNCNIVSFIFQTIRYKGSFATTDGGVIRSKGVVSDPNKDDISYFEDYRKTSAVPIGTSAEIQHALSDLEQLITSLGYDDFDYELYEQELNNHLPTLMSKPIEQVQIYLLGWFLNRIINPRALFYIELTKLVELILLAKVVLLQRGHKFIAMLLSSYRSEAGSYINIISRNVLNRNLVKQLSKHYQFVIEEGETSIIEQTVLKVSKEIVNNIWVPIGNREQLDGVGNREGYLVIPNNINDVVCNYVDFVNS